ncbi:MAG: glycerol kinase GlpK [Polyangia bacterium]
MPAVDGYILAIDQGTTGTTVLLVDAAAGLRVRGRGYREIPQIYPRPGEVEHDPEQLWSSVIGAMEAALGDAAARLTADGAMVNAAGVAARIAAIGITNQRETVVLWERSTGRCVGNAIVWQDRRTSAACAAMKQAGLEPLIRDRTGLVLDPYFSGTKVRWMLDQAPGLAAAAARGEIAFGTVDSFLIWRLSGGAAHVTDSSNASRTLLFDLAQRAFSDELLGLFGVPRALLPAVVGSAEVVASTSKVPGLPDGVPIAGIAGDQQAALFGQDCLQPGDVKCTFGTGAFVLMNVGEAPVRSPSGLLVTVAWTIDGVTSYALEGSAFIAGALVQWLRDGLKIIARAADVEALAASVPDSAGVVIVPALAGLGAPHWRPEARGIITGLTRGTTRAHLARAALEAIALQNVELVAAMRTDAARPINRMRVDGGAAANDLLMQLQADLLGVPVVRPAMLESTALGAAKLAARGVRLALDKAEEQPTEILTVFNPAMPDDERQTLLDRWNLAVAKA